MTEENNEEASAQWPAGGDTLSAVDVKRTGVVQPRSASKRMIRKSENMRRIEEKAVFRRCKLLAEAGRSGV